MSSCEHPCFIHVELRRCPENCNHNKQPFLLDILVPKQKDALSCGYFVLLYAILFLQSCPDTFSATKGYPYFIKKSWFSDDTIESFRDPLKKLFSELVVNVPLVPGNNPTLENKITTLIRSYWSSLGTGRRFADNGEKHNSCGVEEITKMPNNCKRSRAISKEIGESIKISKESMERQKILRGSLEDCEFPKSTEFKMPNNYKQSGAIIKENGESINISKESKESQKVLRGSLEECEFPNSTEFKELRKDLDYYQYLQRQLVVHVVAASKNKETKETNSPAQHFMKRFIQMNQDYNNIIGFLVDKNK
ncbi:hypothetical protein DCAR_0727821 [Daucus carota subsp. sativus]|uniref:Uncharacterized protein n=2 Tax=Daucus carota subsp. sativus TaxID=79200 RepID=A0A161Y446_DAUCS|nr:hypothetical protein DCAR_0727821 [Daucus carota subsp. sativus]